MASKVAKRRRSTMAPEFEELQLTMLTPPAVNTQRETYYLLPRQVQEVRAMSHELQLEGYAYNKSLIARAALRWFLSMSSDDMLNLLADELKREQEQGLRV